MLKRDMAAVYYLDIIIETVQRVPIQFRIALDQTTRDKMLKLTPTNVKLCHVLDTGKFAGLGLKFDDPKPANDPLDRLEIDGGQ